MTPKEKAKELVDKYHKESYIDLRDKDAIEYSKIAIDERMDEIKILLCDLSLSQNSIKLMIKRHDYLQEVKNELEKQNNE